MSMLASYDAIVIGAGIVGASTAWQLQQQRPDWRILILDKEAEPAQHQSGHNSGVVHAGVYYPPGSMKAQFCKEGWQQTLAFCDRHNIQYRQCGKLIVARDQSELPGLDALRQRASQNGLQVSRLSATELREREPYLRGAGAIEIPASAVVDYRQITHTLLTLFQGSGGELELGSEVQALHEEAGGVTVETASRSLFCRHLVCCAGLMADRMVRLMGLPCDFQIIPFRGEFYRLAARCDNWLSHLVYPVPNPSLPFLGVHLTLAVKGGVTAGLNAALAWRREGYHRGDVSLADSVEMLRFAGFWKLLKRHWRAGLKEMSHSYSKGLYLALLQRYCPDIMADDLSAHSSGVRAQAVGVNGELMQDFHFIRTVNSLHVCNAPSPAATSALPIGRHIVAQLLQN